MSSADRRFWLETEKYHDLARQFEENIEITSPKEFFECRLDGLTGHCPFCATRVKYYEYDGPSL